MKSFEAFACLNNVRHFEISVYLSRFGIACGSRHMLNMDGEDSCHSFICDMICRICVDLCMRLLK